VLKSNETMTYIVNGSQGQTLETIISGEGVLMNIIGPDGRPVDNNARRVSYWQGSLPFNGDYSLELSPVQGVSNGRYSLDVSLRSAPRPSPTPTPTPTPVEPSINEIPVSLSGNDAQTFSDRIRPNAINRYVVSATQGTVLNAQVGGGATLRVFNADGRVVSDNGSTSWQGNISYDRQVYRIDTLGPIGTRYTLELSLTP
jgi:serine/threonine-protein kinase